MITPLKNLTVVEDGKDKIIKEMKLDSRYTIPKGVNDKSNSNNINELIDKIHTVNFIERHTKLYHKYSDLFSAAVRPELADVPHDTLMSTLKSGGMPRVGNLQSERR